MTTIEDALNKYYQYKKEFETLKKNTKRHDNNPLLFVCTCCRRKSQQGMFFSITAHPTEGYREFRARCGVMDTPCNFNIHFHLAEQLHKPDIVRATEEQLQESKKQIIQIKNNVLFGQVPMPTEKFNELKEEINEMTGSLLLINANETNQNRQALLSKKEAEYYNGVDQIKSWMREFGDSGNVALTRQVVDYYNSTLMPLLEEIRVLKYSKIYFETSGNVTTAVFTPAEYFTWEDTGTFGENAGDRVIAFQPCSGMCNMTSRSRPSPKTRTVKKK